MRKPAKPDPSKRDKMRFIQSARVSYRMEFAIEFTRPVSLLEGQELGRRLLDSLQVSAKAALPETFDEAVLKCPELRRLIRIHVEPSES